MNNIFNDLFEYIWDPISEKLLICKDDPTIDLGKLKILNSCKEDKEIMNVLLKSSNITIHIK